MELLKEAPYNIFDNKLGGMLFDSCLGLIADHLINNGVTVQEDCKDCPYRTEPITNADRIRAMAMSDEELAAEISRSSNLDLCDIVCSRVCKAVATFKKTSQQRCAEIVLDWLKKPAE